MDRIGFRAHDFGIFDSIDELGSTIEGFRKESWVHFAIQRCLASPRPWREWDEEYISGVSSSLKRHGVNIAIVGCSINPIHPDEDIRKEEIERYIKAMSLHKAFSCPYIGTETGSANGTKGRYCITTAEESNMDMLFQSLDRMIDAAERYDGYVAIECGAHSHALSTLKRAERCIRRYEDTDRLRFILDPINLIPFQGIEEEDGVSILHPTKEAQRAFYMPVIEIIGPRAAAIHMKDFTLNPENGAKIGSLTAFTGSFDWSGFISEYRKRGNDVPWLLENLRPEILSETMSLMRQSGLDF